MNTLTQVLVDRQDVLSSSFSASYAGVVAFITVAREGSFARAADRLGVGRSAVSRSVQRLEDHLGTRLLSRTTRSTSLTSEGELFLENCQPGVESIMQALEEIRDLRDGPPRGQLRIGATHAFGRRVLAPILNDFRLKHPAIGIELVLDERAADLAVDRIDVLFRDGRLDDSQVIARQLIPMQRLVCASSGYAERHGLPLSMEQLGEHACINRRLPNGRIRNWEFRIEGQTRSVVPQAEIVFNDDDLILESVLEGQGLAQLPAFQACEFLRSGRLVASLGHQAPDSGGHYACYLSRRQLPKRIRVFIDFVTAQVRALNLDCGAGLNTSLAMVAPDSPN
ncbi:LysR family transcriptional regulator [Pseudoxanthomonas wuyuanensis]